MVGRLPAALKVFEMDRIHLLAKLGMSRVWRIGRNEKHDSGYLGDAKPRSERFAFEMETLSGQLLPRSNVLAEAAIDLAHVPDEGRVVSVQHPLEHVVEDPAHRTLMGSQVFQH